MLFFPLCVRAEMTTAQGGVNPPVTDSPNAVSSLKNAAFLETLQGRWTITQGFNMAHAVMDFYVSDNRAEAGVYTRIASCIPSWASSLKDAWLDYKRVPVQIDGGRLVFHYTVVSGNFFNRDKNCLSDTVEAATHELHFNLSKVSDDVLVGTLQWGNHPPVAVEFKKRP